VQLSTSAPRLETGYPCEHEPSMNVAGDFNAPGLAGIGAKVMSNEPPAVNPLEQKPTGPIAVEEQRSAASCRCKRTRTPQNMPRT
jgi:hypothetical protein